MHIQNLQNASKNASLEERFQVNVYEFLIFLHILI